MDEKPVQFFDDFRKGFRSKKDGVQYKDYQYIRNGTASIFLFTEPLAGWRYADAQERRTAHDWAKQIEWLLTEQYPVAKRVVLVMDNLNTHSIASLYATFPPQHARELAERLEIHYTPKHGIIVFLAILCGVGGRGRRIGDDGDSQRRRKNRKVVFSFWETAIDIITRLQFTILGNKKVHKLFTELLALSLDECQIR